MGSVYDEIKEETGGRVFLGVGLDIDEQQNSDLVFLSFLDALMGYGYIEKNVKKRFIDDWSDECRKDPDDPVNIEIMEGLRKFAALSPVIEMSELKKA